MVKNPKKHCIYFRNTILLDQYWTTRCTCCTINTTDAVLWNGNIADVNDCKRRGIGDVETIWSIGKAKQAKPWPYIEKVLSKKQF